MLFKKHVVLFDFSLADAIVQCNSYDCQTYIFVNYVFE